MLVYSGCLSFHVPVGKLEFVSYDKLLAHEGHVINYGLDNYFKTHTTLTGYIYIPSVNISTHLEEVSVHSFCVVVFLF
jgi:hypothetical protein